MAAKTDVSVVSAALKDDLSDRQSPLVNGIFSVIAGEMSAEVHRNCVVTKPVSDLIWQDKRLNFSVSDGDLQQDGQQAGQGFHDFGTVKREHEAGTHRGVSPSYGNASTERRFRV
jgi:hypothetical protein